MTIKTILITILFLLLANIGFLLFKGNAPIPIRSTSQNSISVPVPTNHKGVSTFTVDYSFTGKVIKAQSVGKDTRLTLDISDSQTPDFIISENTPIFTVEGKTPREVGPDSIKTGSFVNINMTYNLVAKSWNIVNISLMSVLSPNATLPPPPSTTPPPPPTK